MPFTPAYNALFAKPLLNQLIAILQRDQAAAISVVNPALVPINEFHKGPGARTAFPWLTLAADSTEFDRESPHRSEEHTSELQSRLHLVCRLLLEKKNT